MSNSNGNNTVGLFLLAVLAILVVWIATRFGIGINPDSTVYIDAARNVLDGRGFIALTGSGEFKPLTHYPPVYAALLALLARAGVLLGGFSIETVARALNAFLFGANVLLVGIAIRDYVRDAYWPPILGALMTLAAPDIAGIHTFALTEALFIFLSLSGLLSLSRYVGSKRGAWLVLSAASVALALMTRYVGMALVFTGVFVLLFVKRDNLRRRCFEALSFGLISCTPMALWVLRNMRAAGGVSDREFVFHLAGLRQIVVGLSTVSSWLLLGKVRSDLRIIFFVVEIAAASALVIYLFRSRQANGSVNDDQSGEAMTDKTVHTLRGSSPLTLVFLFFIVSYVAFLIFTASFVDADTVLDARALAPVHVAVIVLVSGLGWRAFKAFRETYLLRITFVAIAIVFLLSYSIRGGMWLIHTRRDGQGYASRTWRESKTIAQIKTLPAGVPIYSNGYDAIYYLTHRPAIYIPEKIKHGTGRENENYDTEVESMGKALKENSGRLVYFNTLTERWFLPSETELKQRLELRIVESNADGSVYVDAER